MFFKISFDSCFLIFFTKYLIALSCVGIPEKQLLYRGTISEYPCKIAELWATK